jgi:hypothetical protein
VIILDTDHIVTLKHENDPHWNTLTTNLVSSADQDFATTAITVEEQNRGWLALINRYTDVHKQIPAYARLIELIRFFADCVLSATVQNLAGPAGGWLCWRAWQRGGVARAALEPGRERWQGLRAGGRLGRKQHGRRGRSAATTGEQSNGAR